MTGAVITGDIIHSTKMTGELRIKLVKAIENYMKYLKKNFDIRYEIYRGDSFQCLVKKTEDALRVALLIKTKIRSLNPSELYNIKKQGTKIEKKTVLTHWIFDARIAIGIGEIGNENIKLAHSEGIAYFNSGHLLDEIKNTKQHLAITSDDDFNPEWETESLLLDAIIRKTTALQCQVINFKLEDYTETEIANRLNIGQSAVNQRSTGGDWAAIDAMVYRFENAYKNG